MVEFVLGGGHGGRRCNFSVGAGGCRESHQASQPHPVGWVWHCWFTAPLGILFHWWLRACYGWSFHVPLNKNLSVLHRQLFTGWLLCSTLDAKQAFTFCASARNSKSEIFHEAGIFIYLLSTENLKKPLNQLHVPAEGSAGNELKILGPFKQQVSSFKTHLFSLFFAQCEHLLLAITNSIQSVPPLLSKDNLERGLGFIICGYSSVVLTPSNDFSKFHWQRM